MKEYDLIIIGSGPAGYVAALRAGQLGIKAAIVEKAKIGGMCLNWGCIPSKTLMESSKLYERTLKASAFGIDGIDPKAVTFNWKKAVDRKNRIVTRLVKGVEFLLKRNNVETISGAARITGANKVTVGDDEYSAKIIIVATGSRPETGKLGPTDRSKIVEIDQLFDMTDIPEKLAIYGSGGTACETAVMLRLIGKKVTVISPQPSMLWFLDSSLSKFIADKFSRSGIAVLAQREITKDGDGGVFAGDDFVECDKVINCADRKAILPEISGVDLEFSDGFVKVDEFMRTSAPSIYAIGDVTGQMTAHAGSAQGSCAVNHIAGAKTSFDPLRIPINIYLDPEIAAVGMTEEQIKDKGIEYRKGEFPLTVNGKAMTEGATEGFVKVLAESKYGEVLGVHIVAPNATDMIAEAAAILQLEGTLEDVGAVVHAHPTVSETVLEASFKAMDKPLHM